MPQVIGLAFVNTASLKIVTRTKLDARTFTTASDIQQWVNGKSKRRKVAIVEDKRVFKKAIESGVPAIIVCTNDVEWLERRGIRVLDAKQRDDFVIVRDDEGRPLMQNVTADLILKELSSSTVYAESTTDVWLSKSNPKGRCAGCKILSECVHDPTPISRRPCGDKYAKDTSERAYRSYSLSQLVHLALNSAAEDKLMTVPKEFWQATYQFAMGQMPRKTWIAEHARLLKSAGCNKTRLQAIAMWVKHFGSALVEGNQTNPPSKLDVKLSRKLCDNS